jgi:hypothetical protein
MVPIFRTAWIWAGSRVAGGHIYSYGRSGYLVCISQTAGPRVNANVKQKTYNLNSGMIDAVRGLFDVKTDTEAIQRALRKAIEDREVEDARDALLKDGRFRTLYR